MFDFNHFILNALSVTLLSYPEQKQVTGRHDEVGARFNLYLILERANLDEVYPGNARHEVGIPEWDARASNTARGNTA